VNLYLVVLLPMEGVSMWRDALSYAANAGGFAMLTALGLLCAAMVSAVLRKWLLAAVHGCCFALLGSIGYALLDFQRPASGAYARALGINVFSLAVAVAFVIMALLAHVLEYPLTAVLYVSCSPLALACMLSASYLQSPSEALGYTVVTLELVAIAVYAAGVLWHRVVRSRRRLAVVSVAGSALL
jgi:hypothetical protein